jgi:hypothetical protein
MLDRIGCGRRRIVLVPSVAPGSRGPVYPGRVDMTIINMPMVVCLNVIVLFFTGHESIPLLRWGIAC